MQDVLAYVALALIAVGCGIFLRRTLVYATTTRSISMLPTLAEGDLLLTRRIHARTRLIRGDIIVLYLDELQQSVVKRLVGLPGDEIAVVSDQMIPVSSKSTGEQSPAQVLDKHGSRRVPPGHYFFLGDNRPRSIDSRSWTQPYVPRSRLEGRVCFRIWPRPQSFTRALKRKTKSAIAEL